MLVKYLTKNATTDVISSQPIACLSDQQADHVTHRKPSASKYSSQGLSQQLSNLQIRRAIKTNTLLNGKNLQQAEFNTKDSCKLLYNCFSNWLQSVQTDTGYTALYTCLNNWLQSVPTCTFYTALYTCFNNRLQSVPTGTGYTALYTCFDNWLQN